MPSTLGMRNDKPADSEYPKVLGHSRATDGQQLGQFADRTRLPG
jgi:hypothetical protein